MSGHVYYRFKSQKEFQRIIFEGIGISVWDLKREIIQESKMGRAPTSTLLSTTLTPTKYANDHAIIPRSSSVIARRLPPKRPGHGNAQQYVGVNLTGSNSRTNPPSDCSCRLARGRGDLKRFQKSSPEPFQHSPNERKHFSLLHNHIQPLPPLIEPAALLSLSLSLNTQTFTPVLTGGERDSEAESMAAMFAAQDQQWQKTQETMATQELASEIVAVASIGSTKLERMVVIMDRVDRDHLPIQILPLATSIAIMVKASFILKLPLLKATSAYRCGQKAFLQKVESGKPVDGQNVMVTSDGSFVIAKPDKLSTFFLAISAQHHLQLGPSFVCQKSGNKRVAIIMPKKAADNVLKTPILVGQHATDLFLMLNFSATWKQHKSVVVKNLSAADIENQRPSDPDLSHSSVCPECETKVSFNPASSSSSSSTNPPNNNKAFIIDDERRKRSDDYIQEILKLVKLLNWNKSNRTRIKQPLRLLRKSGPEAQETPSDSKQEDEPNPQATKPEETSPSDPATAGTPQAAQPKDDSKATSAEKSDQSNANPSSGKEAPQVTISTEVAKLSPTEAKNTRSAGPGSAGASHTPNMMNGMMEFGNKEFGRFGLGPGMALNGAGGNMPMMHGMGMNGMGMGYMGNGMMMGKMMEPMMMNGMGGAGHNVVMNSNQIGFGGPMHAGNGMAMELGNGAGPEAMLGVQLNQQQNLQQQLAMVQQMGAGVGPVNHMMDHGMMNNMHMAAGNGMLMNHPFGNSLGVHHRQQQQDFNQNTSFGPFGMANFGGAHPLGFPSNGLHGHHPNQVGGGLGMKQVNQIPQFNQHQKHPHPNLSSNFQRPVGNHHNHLNAYNRRPPHHLNNPQTPHPLNQPNQHLAAHSNSHRDNPKRKRPEDLIELESGEKVPRYIIHHKFGIKS
ncbi:hypothetical protein PGT21_033516 [Puccinia graminis f. sp. tritici]|uniref:DWNN domain-containing protein n=1 Tax=Puccinia graminis f. sp. tritici TaxID=56615 RepID=A0A5B0MYE9_PUCGR|nr:hypothetical protein PGT21_033516 [Puccinia graminis f. sp. tritici]